MTETAQFEFQNFISLQQEVREALAADDRETAALAVAEIGGIAMHSEWPRLRSACEAFLQRHGDLVGAVPFAV